MIDNDIFERLAEYDNMFYTATQRNYVMFGTLDNKKKLSQLYTEVFKKKSNMMMNHQCNKPNRKIIK